MDSYNSKYPLEYYSIGSPYLFYISNGGVKVGKAATIEQIKKYGGALKQDVPQASPQMAGDVPSRRSTVRCVGVVVNKAADKDSAFIEAMFLGETEGKQVYLIKKYIVAHSSGVFFDNNESCAASNSVDLSNDVKIDFSQQTRRGGGITISAGSRVNGGITRSRHAGKSSGGITISEKK